MMRRTKNVRKGGSVGLKVLAPLYLSLKISAQGNNLNPELQYGWGNRMALPVGTGNYL